MSDERQNPEALVTSFMSRTDPRQNAMAFHMKFTQADSLPVHMHWEVVREFLLMQVVDAYELALIMIRHDPFERGFVDAAAAPQLVFGRKGESLVSLWASRSKSSPARLVTHRRPRPPRGHENLNGKSH